MKRAIFLFLLSLFLLGTFPVFAQNIPYQNNNQNIKYLLNVTPAIINFEITPGKRQEFKVTIENFLDRPMGIRTSVEPLTYPDESADYLRETPLLKWTSFETEEFIIDAQSKKTFTVILNTPQDAPRGGQYAVVFLTPFYSQIVNDDTPTILSKVGLLLIGTYGETNFEDLKKNVQITKFGSPLITDKTEVTNTITVRNGYYNHLNAKPYISYSPVFGAKKSIEGDEKNVLPKTTRLWETSYSIDPKLPLLIYKADLKLSIGEGNQIEKTTYFIYFAYLSYFKYLIFLFIPLIIFKFRKRLKKAAKILLTNR